MITDQQPQRPVCEAFEIKGGRGYGVHVCWPDGFTQYVTEFADEAQARQWIADHEPRWHEWVAAYRQRPRR